MNKIKGVFIERIAALEEGAQEAKEKAIRAIESDDLDSAAIMVLKAQSFQIAKNQLAVCLDRAGI